MLQARRRDAIRGVYGPGQARLKVIQARPFSHQIQDQIKPMSLTAGSTRVRLKKSINIINMSGQAAPLSIYIEWHEIIVQVGPKSNTSQQCAIVCCYHRVNLIDCNRIHKIFEIQNIEKFQSRMFFCTLGTSTKVCDGPTKT